MIRRAKVADVPFVARIINDCAEYGLMLHRSLEYLYERVRDFHVAVESERVIGCCGLRVVWANYAEVYSLALEPAWRGKGWGRSLVEACVEEARQLGIPRLMTLTYERRFFEKLGFTDLDRQQLPLKVWSECLRCSKNQACDEVAMVRALPDVPQGPTPQPSEYPPDPYIMPVTLTVTRAGRPIEPRSKMDEAPE